ncbi:MAG: hypothetical protein ACT4NU_01920 [Chromatiales bacterium]
MYHKIFSAAYALALSLSMSAANGADFGSAMVQYQQGNYPAAYREFTLLANQGDADAQFVLADMYANGQGVGRDVVQAHKWYSLAARNGAPGATKVRDDLARKMTAQEIGEAERLAREWRPSGHALAEGSTPTPPAGATPNAAPTPAPPPASSGGGFFSKLARGATGLLGGASSSYGTAQAPTATIGIRGLSAEELRAASPNMAALQQMEGYQVSDGEAAGFARSAQLTAQSVPYLAAPSAAAPKPARNPLTGQ